LDSLQRARKQDSSFSEEKEAKRLFIHLHRAARSGAVQRRESFLFLFFKKERLP
jgi:hypothetical protein